MTSYGNNLLRHSEGPYRIPKNTNNIVILKKISALKDAIIANPYTGIGKPELLKYQLSGKWSRRIDKANRFVYSIEDNTLHILSLKGHY